MVLSMEKTLGLMLCASSSLAASERVRTAPVLRPQSHRILANGIHHSIEYAPNVVANVEYSNSEDTSYDSYVATGSEPIDLKLKPSEEMEINTVEENLDVDVDGPIDADVTLSDTEDMVIDADKDQDVELSTYDSLDTVVAGSIDPTHQLDSEIDFAQGDVEVELEDDEAYEQNLEIGDDEELDEFIDIPEGAKSIHLRMHKGNVDLDIIKNDIKKDAAPKEETPKKETPKEETPKKETPKEETSKEKAPATETKEASVSHAADSKSWIQNNAIQAPVIGSLIGAAVGIVGLAVVAIAKSRKRAAEKSAEDTSADVDADVESDAASESDSDEDSDEDVEAGVTALTEENAVKEDAVEEDTVEEDTVKEKKANVVEGSV